MISFVSTRFTNETWRENLNYRKNKNFKGCIYGSPQEMSPNILINSNVFVVEMNNDENKIEGIGYIKNYTYTDKYYKIYSEGNYNRYVYKSKYYIDRDTILRYDENLIELLNEILFKGKTHSKRGSGFTKIPEKLLNSEKNKNIKKLIKNIFIMHYSNK